MPSHPPRASASCGLALPLCQLTGSRRFPEGFMVSSDLEPLRNHVFRMQRYRSEVSVAETLWLVLVRALFYGSERHAGSPSTLSCAVLLYRLQRSYRHVSPVCLYCLFAGPPERAACLSSGRQRGGQPCASHFQLNPIVPSDRRGPHFALRSGETTPSDGDPHGLAHWGRGVPDQDRPCATSADGPSPIQPLPPPRKK